MPQPIVLDLVRPYSAAPELERGPEPALGVSRQPDNTWVLRLVLFGPRAGSGVALDAAIPVVVDHVPTKDEMQAAGRPLYGLRKLAPGVWKLAAPLPVRLAAELSFVAVLTDVPEPAPWESRLVLAS